MLSTAKIQIDSFLFYDSSRCT